MTGASPGHQGHLGDLQSKTTPELMDLLQRQESILQKQKFVRSLPDGGRKLRESAENLHRMIIERQRREGRQVQRETTQSTLSANDGQKPVSQFAKLRDKRVTGPEAAGRDLEVEMQSLSVRDPGEPDLSHLINTASRDKVYIHEEHPTTQSVNSYLKVIQRSGQVSDQSKQRFKPNRSLNIASVEELPDKFRGQNVKKSNEAESHVDEDSAGTDRGRKINKVTGRVMDEENAQSSATPPKYKYDSVKLISLDESFLLQQSQAVKQEELRAQHAAERLAEKLHIKMEPYQPDGKMAMAYRTPDEPEAELDSDDNEEDYPD